MEYKFEYQYIIINDVHWEDVLEIGKKYYIYYDDDFEFSN